MLKEKQFYLWTEPVLDRARNWLLPPMMLPPPPIGWPPMGSVGAMLPRPKVLIVPTA